VPAADEKLQIYLTHRAALVEYALPMVGGDRMRAEDVVQEAFIRFLPGRASAADTTVTQPLGYLYRIVRNLAYDFSRRRAAEQRHLQEAPSWWVIPSTPRTPEQELAHSQELERIDAILAQLSPHARKAVEMHRGGGHTLREIADCLGVSLNTAHRLVREGVARVAMHLSSSDN
jgi:RNA polymerase sigma-70 factor (ECF subfamily)